MFSSVAHLARANPFHAPHLQLVQEGSAAPPPPRRARSLAAAAVEGEAGPPRRGVGARGTAASWH